MTRCQGGASKADLRSEGCGRLEQGSDANPAFVSGVKHNPPGPPLLVEMFKGHKNTVLLTWKPPEPAPETPFIYRLERQEVGSEDWIQCFSIVKAGAVEVPGDCVPSEGDYRFRICTVSEHGRSPHVVFHGSAHLGESVLPARPISSCTPSLARPITLLPSLALSPWPVICLLPADFPLCAAPPPPLPRF